MEFVRKYRLKRCCSTIALTSLQVTKKQIPNKDKMKSSNYNNLCSKCYLRFIKIVPVQMESKYALAYAMTDY